MPVTYNFGVALHFFPERFVRSVVFHARFELAKILGLVLENDAIEITCQIGEHAVLRDLCNNRGLLELRGQLARGARLGNKTIFERRSWDLLSRSE